MDRINIKLTTAIWLSIFTHMAATPAVGACYIDGVRNRLANCEGAVEMQTMVKCEHLAAESRGWSSFDWAEHCLKQARGIPEDEVCEHYTLRQWQFVSKKS